MSRRFRPAGALGSSKARPSESSSASPPASAETPVKLGGIGPGDTTHDVARVLQATLGLPIQLVRGYKGTADIRLAAEAKRAKLEVDPIGGEETDRLVQDLFTLDPALAGKLRGTLR